MRRALANHLINGSGLDKIWQTALDAVSETFLMAMHKL